MAEKKGSGKVSEKKTKEVQELIKLLDESKTIAIVNMENLPARQLLVIKNKVRNKVRIRMSKKVLIEHAFEACKNKSIKSLLPYVKGMPALMFADLDAFELFGLLKQNQSPAGAKVGQVSPRDIEIKDGPTGIAPGPAITTFSAVGLQAGVEAGKISIKKPKIILKQGEEFTQQVVDVCNLLKITPMVIGINIVAVLEENGQLYESKGLNIDLDMFKQMVATAHLDAFKLAIGANIVTPETVTFLITKAELDARALATQPGLSAEKAVEVAEKQAEAVKEAIDG